MTIEQFDEQVPEESVPSPRDLSEKEREELAKTIRQAREKAEERKEEEGDNPGADS